MKSRYHFVTDKQFFIFIEIEMFAFAKPCYCIGKRGNSSTGITEIAIFIIALNTAIGQHLPTGFEMVSDLPENDKYSSPTSRHLRIHGILSLKDTSTQYFTQFSFRLSHGTLYLHLVSHSYLQSALYCGIN